ncbi:hypothetical protein E7T06_05215 [Deinococcus sp. Arct2-2]|uniref:hypothetical protein n=1 Tax=Deinococcus sp. Arct2-2 TaxID=2568653 RepID=UPI0010A557CE|nr:hypothetical protein [Deinococcus sp. Arct2-2]THF70956.1 hypothetical protein E7T06_05215 [Deinococcus sp. Arct2-2]
MTKTPREQSTPLLLTPSSSGSGQGKPPKPRPHRAAGGDNNAGLLNGLILVSDAQKTNETAVESLQTKVVAVQQRQEEVESGIQELITTSHEWQQAFERAEGKTDQLQLALTEALAAFQQALTVQATSNTLLEAEQERSVAALALLEEAQEMLGLMQGVVARLLERPTGWRAVAAWARRLWHRLRGNAQGNADDTE